MMSLIFFIKRYWSNYSLFERKIISHKKVEELETGFDKWLYILKNLNKLDRIPEKLKENIFLKLFETAEIAKFTQKEYQEYQEYQEYEDSLKYYRDLKNSFDMAKK